MSTPLSFINPNLTTAVDAVAPVPSAPLPGTATADLAQTLHAFEQWRANKVNPSEAIPEALWRQIFALAKIFSPAKVRAFFNLSPGQYQKKFQELYPVEAAAALKTEPTSAAVAPTAFCEVKTTKPFYTPQPLPTPTPPFVIEFCRQDGCIMKIYTSADRFSGLLAAFFAGNDHAVPAR